MEFRVICRKAEIEMKIEKVDEKIWNIIIKLQKGGGRKEAG